MHGNTSRDITSEQQHNLNIVQKLSKIIVEISSDSHYNNINNEVKTENRT